MANHPALGETDYFRAWLPFVICQAIGGFVVGAVAGGLVGAVLAVLGNEPGTSSFNLTTGAAGFIASLPVSYYFFRMFVLRLWDRKHATATPSASDAI